MNGMYVLERLCWRLVAKKQIKYGEAEPRHQNKDKGDSHSPSENVKQKRKPTRHSNESVE
jgi:hypothetical protein